MISLTYLSGLLFAIVLVLHFGGIKSEVSWWGLPFEQFYANNELKYAIQFGIHFVCNQNYPKNESLLQQIMSAQEGDEPDYLTQVNAINARSSMLKQETKFVRFR